PFTCHFLLFTYSDNQQLASGNRVFYSSLRIDGDQKLDVYAERQDFIQHLSQVVKVLTEEDTGHPETGDAIARLKEVLEYCAIRGKYHRGLTVLVAFWELSEPRKQDADSLRWAMTEGWCVELLQAFLLVSDDLTDAFFTRRGRICWYQKPCIGLAAIHDAFLLEACIYRLLKLCCWEQPYYLNLIELFLQSPYQTEIGQTLDLITAPQDSVDLGRFTEKGYRSIVKYKTAFYSFCLSIAAAMYVVGIDGKKEHTDDENLDLFGDPSVMGKIGTDIQDNKCSWLVVQCLQRAEKVAGVKAPDEEMNLLAVFTQHKEDSYSYLTGLTEQYAVPLSPATILGPAHKIYKQKKSPRDSRGEGRLSKNYCLTCERKGRPTVIRLLLMCASL
uniref:Farnesyl pyrophosphate synthase n=1 Tax=Phocoena sinus TaxID=42100 RepID=A0A8C9E057_PHOSS